MTAAGETYQQVHARLRRERGPARDHPCAHGCGKQAAQWAFAHTDPDVPPDLLRPYSTNLDHYLPLCAKCHRALDADHYAVDRSCRLCGNEFRGHFMRLYCSEPCRATAAERWAHKRKRPANRGAK